MYIRDERERERELERRVQMRKKRESIDERIKVSIYTLITGNRRDNATRPPLNFGIH